MVYKITLVLTSDTISEPFVIESNSGALSRFICLSRFWAQCNIYIEQISRSVTITVVVRPVKYLQTVDTSTWRVLIPADCTHSLSRSVCLLSCCPSGTMLIISISINSQHLQSTERLIRCREKSFLEVSIRTSSDWLKELWVLSESDYNSYEIILWCM